MKIIFSAVFGDNVHYSKELFYFRSRCTVHEGETQLFTSNDSVGRGSIYEEGQRNTNCVDTEEIAKRWLKVMV